MTLDAPPVDWPIVFEEHFDELRLEQPGRPGVWKPTYPAERRSNYNAKELELYVDPSYADPRGALFGYNPFSTDRGVLSITAAPVAPEQRWRTENFPYVSGILTTETSFQFTYGFAEIRAKLPAGKGLWPAFWLLPTDRSWPPEIDVFEVLGDRPTLVYMTSHSKHTGTRTASSHKIDTADLSAAFHTYAVKWTAQTLTWYLDGQPVAASPTPADMRKPMYLLLNLAVGGTWPGAPNASTVFPARLEVDYVLVRQARGDATAQR